METKVSLCKIVQKKLERIYFCLLNSMPVCTLFFFFFFLKSWFFFVLKDLYKNQYFTYAILKKISVPHYAYKQ